MEVHMNKRKEYYKNWAKTKNGLYSRKKAWTKYNRSKKKSIAVSKYYYAHKKKISLYKKYWRKRNPDKLVSYREKYYSKNYHKLYAKRVVRNEVKYGRIKKMNCLICDSKESQGHHPDYSKPKEVIWLCQQHHSDIHHNKLSISTLAPISLISLSK